MWATFIGSTFAQTPVSGVRKSGMPEGTETPAPVSATVQSDSPISSASLAAPSRSSRDISPAGGCRRRARASLPAAPARSALAEEGGDALLRVLAAEGGREALL